MGVYFTSDLHLGHRSIVKYRDEFKTSKEHDDYIIDKILSLGKRDVLFVIGDFLFDGPHYDEYIQRLKKMKCRLKLVMGNHDSLNLYNTYEHPFEIQLPLFSYKGIWVQHSPIHPCEMRFRNGQIHGHLHKSKVMDGEHIDNRYFNVNLDVNNYEFVKLETIKEHLKGNK